MTRTPSPSPSTKKSTPSLSKAPSSASLSASSSSSSTSSESSSSQYLGALSQSQRKRFQQLAQAVVQDTASQYAETIKAAPASLQRAIDSTKWKAVRRRDNFQVYKSRKAPSTMHTQAKVLGVGRINGTMEDAMYGASTPTELAMYTRSLYLEDQFVAHRVLHDIEAPTEEEPFRYLGIKWAARSSAVLSVVKPRDLVYLEASGFHDIKLERGTQRLGYIVYHSVDLHSSQGVDQRSTDMVRGRMYLCVLYRELGLGEVEVFSTLTSEPGGSVPQRLAEISAAEALISIANITNSVLNKKLAWMLNQSGHDISEFTSSMQGRRFQLPTFRSLTPCMICVKGGHPREMMKRKLVLKREAATPVYRTVSICKVCITAAIRLDNVAQIAWEEFAETSGRSSKALEEVTSSSRDLQEDLMLMSMRVNVDAVELEDTDSESEPVEEVLETITPYRVRKQANNNDVAAHERMVMIKQMQQLCMQAERTYTIARHQTLSLHDNVASPVEGGMRKPPYSL